MPKISVIIPTYNRAKLLPRAIDSVLNQTFSDWELIVVNDNSSDNTDDVMKKYNDPRIIYIKHAKNKGGSAARNNGLKAAKGEYIAFLDDDDRWLSTKLEKQVNIFENSLSKIGVIYSGVVRIDDTTQECLLRFRPSSKGRVYKEMLLCSFVHSATYMARRKCFKKVGYYDESLPGHHEWDMLLRIAEVFDFDYVNEILAEHHIHEKHISTDLNKKIQAWKIFLEKHKGKYKNYPKYYSMHLNYYARLLCLADRNDEARKRFIESTRYFPFQKSSYIHYFLSIFFPDTNKKVIDKKINKINGVNFY